jgi:lipoic acid synthetase
MKKKRPSWLKVRLRLGDDFHRVDSILNKWKINTVCREALCPNISECYNKKRATFLILGDYCTRNCSFCGVKKGNPLPLDPKEPERLTQVVKEVGLTHVVVTSVTRDDLPDGGATVFASTIEKIKKLKIDSLVEVLIPDLKGSKKSLSIILNAFPHILGHNLETVQNLYSKVRIGADYRRSLNILRTAKELFPHGVTKSGLMLGLGEEKKEVLQVMDDLRETGCDLLTLGQYLPPSNGSFPVQRYYEPSEFDDLFKEGMKRGFKWVESGPLVRSSYHAEEQWKSSLMSNYGS